MSANDRDGRIAKYIRGTAEIDVSAYDGEAFDLELESDGEQHRWRNIGTTRAAI